MFCPSVHDVILIVRDVDNLVLDPSKRSTLTLDDLALPLDDKGDDYYEQVEEQMFEQDELDRRGMH